VTASGRESPLIARFAGALGHPADRQVPGFQIPGVPGRHLATLGRVGAWCVRGNLENWNPENLPRCAPQGGHGCPMECGGRRGGEAGQRGTKIGVVPSVMRVGRSLTGETLWEALLHDGPHQLFFCCTRRSRRAARVRGLERPSIADTGR